MRLKTIKLKKLLWKKIQTRVWRLPAQAHNTIVRNLTCDVDQQFFFENNIYFIQKKQIYKKIHRYFAKSIYTYNQY